MKNIRLGKKQNETKENKLIDTTSPELISKVEDKVKRSAFAKHFNNNDGTFTMELHSDPIHYYDNQTKQFEDIDNNLIEEEGKFTIKRNNFQLTFNKELDENKFFSIKKDNNTISLKYLGKQEKNNRKTFRKSKAVNKNINRLNSSLIYEEIAPNIDLEYLIQSNRIKENIIIKQKQNSYEFAFELEIGELTARLAKDNRGLELYDSNNIVQSIIPSPAMIDSSGNESLEVFYDFEEINDGVLSLTVKASSEWINNEERVLPVKIDPQIISIIDESSILEEYQIKNNKITVVDKYAIGKGYPELDFVKFMNIYLEHLEEYEVVKMEYSDNLDYSPHPSFVRMKICAYSQTIDKMNQEAFIFDRNKCTLIKDFDTVDPVRNFTIDITDVYRYWKNNNHSIGGLVFDHYGGSGIINFDDSRLTINYKVETISPLHYLNLGEGHKVEIQPMLEVGLDIGEKGQGVLTTYIDQINNKVYQQYQTNNQFYVRENIDNLSWKKWENSSDISIQDNRNENFSPSDYMKKGSRIVSEFKKSSEMECSKFNVDQYGILTTYVPWHNDSGGFVYQEYRSNGIVLIRKSFKTGIIYSWEDWDLLSSYITPKDTRISNYGPMDYMKKGSRIVSEFKESSAIECADLGVGTYGILTTYVPWHNATGGLPYQEYRSNGILLTRKATSNFGGWEDWNLLSSYYITPKDTRISNYGPMDYMEKGSRIVSEFKESSAIECADLGVGTYGILTTYVPWHNDSGGFVYQEYRSNGILLTRKATSDFCEWEDWTRSGLKARYADGILFITDDGSNP